MNIPDPGAAGALHDQPHLFVERDGVHYTLLGTAHVSRASVDAVEAEVARGDYDTIAIELDAQRHRALTDPDALAKLALFQILREGKTGRVAATLALAAYQRRLAEQLGVEPGAELKAASLGAQQRGLRMALIDRDVGITLRRAFSRLGFWGRTKLIAGLGASLFADEKVGSDGARRVLAVVGAGHLKGLAAMLREGTVPPADELAGLDALERRSDIPWFTIVLVAFLLGGFAWGFWQGGAETGGDMVLQWAVTTAIGGALGCLAAGGHPLSILAAAVSSPLTPLHPALASGTVSALVEAWLRKPTYADFLRLRDDTSRLTGWWRNRVARVLVNFFLTSLGTGIAVWIAGAALIGRLG